MAFKSTYPSRSDAQGKWHRCLIIVTQLCYHCLLVSHLPASIDFESFDCPVHEVTVNVKWHASHWLDLYKLSNDDSRRLSWLWDYFLQGPAQSLWQAFWFKCFGRTRLFTGLLGCAYSFLGLHLCPPALVMSAVIFENLRSAIHWSCELAHKV